MAATLAFQTLAPECHMMQVQDAEGGAEIFCLFRERPASVVKDLRVYKAANGRKFQTGIVLVADHGCGVAWPV